MLIKQVHQKSVLFAIINTFQADVYNRCHDTLMVFINPNDIATLNILGVDYCYFITEISKSEALNLFKILI